MKRSTFLLVLICIVGCKPAEPNLWQDENAFHAYGDYAGEALLLNPDSTFWYVAEGDGGYRNSYNGTYWVRSDMTILISNDKIVDTLYTIKWGGCVFLTRSVKNFCYFINAGWVDVESPHKPGLHKCISDTIPLSDWPNLRKEDEKFLLRTPIGVKIIDINAKFLTIDKGLDAGVLPNMTLFYGEPSALIEIEVISVHKDSAISVFKYKEPINTRVRLGDSLYTKPKHFVKIR